jgi:hypothetical protein
MQDRLSVLSGFRIWVNCKKVAHNQTLSWRFRPRHLKRHRPDFLITKNLFIAEEVGAENLETLTMLALVFQDRTMIG